MDIKTFADVRNLLTTSVSAGFSKDSSSIHLIHTIQSHNNTTTLITNALHVGTDRDLVPKCKAFVRSVAVVFLALYRVY